MGEDVGFFIMGFRSMGFAKPKYLNTILIYSTSGLKRVCQKIRTVKLGDLELAFLFTIFYF